MSIQSKHFVAMGPKLQWCMKQKIKRMQTLFQTEKVKNQHLPYVYSVFFINKNSVFT